MGSKGADRNHKKQAIIYIIAKEQEARWMKKHALVKGADEI